MKRCAVCDNDHSTHRLCVECKRDPANRDWRSPSAKEAGGWNVDDFEAGASSNALSRRDPYAGPLAIEIMKLHVFGMSNRAIARAVECDRRHVDRTVLYWQTNRGEKLQMIIDAARISGMTQCRRGQAGWYI